MLSPMEHPGEVTKIWRKEKKWSIPKLARISKIDKGTISRFERGGDFRRRVFVSICGALSKQPRDVYAILAQGMEPAPLLAPAHSPEHEELHRKLQLILDADGNYSLGIELNIEAIYQYLMSGLPPKTKNPSKFWVMINLRG